MRRTYVGRTLMGGLGAILIATAAGAAPCDAPAYRDFDFWTGQWQVHRPDGTLAGSNRITREYDGCVIHEHYTTDEGYSGESLNTYDASRGVWHQTWVDNAGTLLLLEGGLSGDNMVLKGETIGDDGILTRHRITWTPMPDGSVRQLWEAGKKNESWKVMFDGRYTHARQDTATGQPVR